MRPFLNIAFDFADHTELGFQVEQAVAGGADVVEVGTPVLKRYGTQALSEIRKILPHSVGLYADLKLLDFPEAELIPALEAGATVLSALVLATDETLQLAAQLASEHGAQLWVSTMGWEGPSLIQRIEDLRDLGIGTFVAHGAGKDPADAFEQMLARASLLTQIDGVAVVLGGGITHQNLPGVLHLKPAGVIVGRGATASSDIAAAVSDLVLLLESSAG